MNEKDIRPWGEYEVLADTASYKVKRITVKAQQRLSYQKHYKRAEHWYIVSGQAIVVLDGAEIHLHAGQAIDIPLEAAHRIMNMHQSDDLIFIEVQTGIYFGEDDIVRLEDDYQRQ